MPPLQQPFQPEVLPVVQPADDTDAIHVQDLSDLGGTPPLPMELNGMGTPSNPVLTRPLCFVPQFFQCAPCFRITTNP